MSETVNFICYHLKRRTLFIGSNYLTYYTVSIISINDFGFGSSGCSFPVQHFVTIFSNSLFEIW